MLASAQSDKATTLANVQLTAAYQSLTSEQQAEISASGKIRLIVFNRLSQL